ncbi:MAG: hypothetical protein GTO02_21270 [Candidatus Dadabacteria bacterium]|nr:hypothetical protein [Candidatus Dadabacteria bacterium]NIQ16816.1 hypothetical protein [Candidatus Dadabacteria bacterium]
MLKKLIDEIKKLALLTAYFIVWIGVLVILKKLLLAEYNIRFEGWSMVLIGALILSKTVAVLEHVSLGAWVRSKPALVEIILRTFLYTCGVFLILILEKTVSGRHVHGGLIPSLISEFKEAEMHHVMINTICISGSLLFYNIMSVIRLHLGKGGLLRIFLSPVPKL